MNIAITLLAASALATVSCASQASPSRFAVSSAGVSRTNVLATGFTCDGERASPPLAWTNPPAGTRFFAVTMHHIPGPGDKHVYMVIYNIPGTATSLPKNAKNLGSWGINTVNRQPEYTPPCSQGPGLKTYTLTVYALSSEAKFADPGKPVTLDALLAAIKDKTLGAAALDVNYSRPGNATTSREPREPRGPGGPRLPPELEHALADMTLSPDRKLKVQAAVQQFSEKQRQLREDLMKQLKATLDPEQYARIEAAAQQPRRQDMRR